MKNAIPEICMTQDSMYHSNWFFKAFINIIAMYNSPPRINAIPPTISYFQAISRTINKTSTGMLCINNPNAICQMLNSGEITSSDINVKNSKNINDKILAVQ